MVGATERDRLPRAAYDLDALPSLLVAHLGRPRLAARVRVSPGLLVSAIGVTLVC